MKVSDLMTRDVQTCWPSDPLNCAAGIMWDYDCGCVPVVDGENRVIGILTDRDVCMAAYTTGCRLHEINAEQAMARLVRCCRETDDLELVHQIMREHRVRRLPVVDGGGRLVGIISVSDVTRGVAGSRAAAERNQLIATLASVTRKRRENEIVPDSDVA